LLLMSSVISIKLKWWLLGSLLHIIVVHLPAQPVSIDPENPHYLHYHNKPVLLITSAEHYGAVINANFDYHLYLRTLHREGMNYTRIFAGSYVEVPGSFGIEHNSLSPE